MLRPPARLIEDSLDRFEVGEPWPGCLGEISSQPSALSIQPNKRPSGRSFAASTPLRFRRAAKELNADGKVLIAETEC